MNKLWEMMQMYQDTNLKENGISFAKEGFTQLYKQVAETNWEHEKELKLATGKGIVIGAVGVGLIGLGVKQISTIRKNNLNSQQEDEEIQKLIEKVFDGDEPDNEEQKEGKESYDEEKRSNDMKKLARELLDSYRKTL